MEWYFVASWACFLMLFARIKSLRNECESLKVGLYHTERKLDQLLESFDFAICELRDSTKDTNDFLKGSGMYDPRYRSDP